MPSSFDIETKRGRPAIIAAVMFVILLLSLGAAYWLVTTRTTEPRNRGIEIIKELRGKKLSQWLGTERVGMVFEIHDAKGKLVGKRVVRRYFESGVLHMRIEETILGAKGIGASVVTYQLADDLSECYYSAVTGNDLTELKIEGKKLSVFRQIKTPNGPYAKRGSAEIPDDYIPDGVMPVLLRIMAGKDKPAGFHIAIDNNIIEGEKVQLTGLTAEPLGDGKVRTLTSTLGGTTEIYHLDENGEIKQIDLPDSGVTYVRTFIGSQPDEESTEGGDAPATTTAADAGDDAADDVETP